MSKPSGRERMLMWCYRRGIAPHRMAYGRIRAETDLPAGLVDIYVTQLLEMRHLALCGSGYWVTRAGRAALRAP